MLFYPLHDVRAYGANFDVMAASVFERCSGHFASNAPAAEFLAGHHVVGNKDGTVSFTFVFEVSGFAGLFFGNKSILI